MLAYIIAFLCVIGISAGQILFKICAIATEQTGGIFSKSALSAFFCAMTLYGIASIAWIWVLQKIDLNRAYPFMALGFVLVPLASHYIFGEPLSPQYHFGIVLVVVGILVLVKS